MAAPVPDDNPPAQAQAADAATLEKNLRALARLDPALAERLRSTAPAALTWSASKAGPWVASVAPANPGLASAGPPARPIALASRYDPVAEAGKLLGEIDRTQVACVALLGLGVGYHAQRAVADAGRQDVVVVYEPDLATLRAVLERVDHSGWLGDRRVYLFTEAPDRAKLTQRLEPVAATLIQGTRVVVHPAVRRLHAEAVAAFHEAFTETLAYGRTTIATALVNSARTCRNLVMNLPWYAACDTTDALQGAAAGRVAVCVAAGPSLVKNVRLLTDPATRERVVVISTQTTLRPLLDRGIRPDFVTALDYSPISSRFYEGLPDLDDVTLVAEPKAHNEILRGFPGPIRLTHNALNDNLLGELARPRVVMPPGATVAHLSFYLAQHLGCDPIVMIGQDLGFSDGLYYAPGTAVHRVWSSELGPFNSLEMMEWQRIVRMRGHLRRETDQQGRPMFTDEQMVTYLKQFERDFEAATQHVIDATEGGLAKAHTTAMPLAEALERYATEDVPVLPTARRGFDPARLRELDGLLRRRRDELEELRRVTAQTLPLLRDMKKHQRDRAKMNNLFDRLSKHQRRVAGDLRAAFETATQVNTLGSFRRSRTDRAMDHTARGPFERQLQQLERDYDNLEWLGQACLETRAIFDDTLAQLPALLDPAPPSTGGPTPALAA